jgi:hypothetical protein
MVTTSLFPVKVTSTSLKLLKKQALNSTIHAVLAHALPV